MAGKPPKGAEKVFPPWASEFLDKCIPGALLPYPPCAGEENLVGARSLRETCFLPGAKVE